VWEKGNFETRNLVNHVVTLLGESPIEIVRRAPRQMPYASLEADRTTERPTILIIDDNEDDVRRMRMLLERDGSYLLLTAFDGREGLKAMHQYRPDLVILDLILPDMHGITIMELMMEDLNLNEIPIIVYSAKDVTPDEYSQWTERIRTIVHKSSFDKQQFVTIVNNMLLD
jgi:PleD family two-component response regulator